MNASSVSVTLEIQYLVEEVENCNNGYAVTNHFDNLCGHSGLHRIRCEYEFVLNPLSG